MLGLIWNLFTISVGTEAIIFSNLGIVELTITVSTFLILPLNGSPKPGMMMHAYNAGL
jgi:hypothetical protein